MEYNALDIAMYIVSYCNDRGKPVSNLKLQKMLYYIWIEFFKKRRERLFLNKIYAWPFGPVVLDVYNKFCAYGGSPIRKNYDNININGRDIDCINSSIEKYINYSASKLVSMTHRENTPWYKIFNGGKGNKAVIPFEMIEILECNSNAQL